MYQKDSDKTMLIASMEKLVNYIDISRQNQAQIFRSLSKNDIKKILNNFYDQNSKLRKLSLTFLGLLLNGNIQHKRQFCKRMEITQIPGKICLDLKLENRFQISGERAMQLFMLLKQSVKKEDQNFPLWMINLRKSPFSINYVPITALNYIDPLDNLIGFVLPQLKSQTHIQKKFSLFQSVSQCVEGIRRKPDFKLAPSTERFSSSSTQMSNRFNRTSNKKTSLKQSLKGSIMRTKQNIDQTFAIDQKPKFIKINQRIKSEAGSPQKETFLFSKASQNSINKLKTIHKSRFEQSQMSTQIQRKSYQPYQYQGQPIVNHTSIYLNGPVNSVYINQERNGNNQNKQQPFQGVSVSTCRNQLRQMQPNFDFQMSNEQKQVVNMFYTPKKRYERVTQKTPQNEGIKYDNFKNQGNNHENNKTYNIGQYRQFMNRVSNTSRNQGTASQVVQVEVLK